MERASFWFIVAVLAVTGADLALGDRCASLPDGTFINDYSECDTFFTCVRGVSVPGRCPEPFIFSEVEQLCDFPWNVICILCPQPVDGEELPGFTFEVIEGECSVYAVCANGIGSLRECGPGLMYDPAQEVCDLEENVDCTVAVCPNSINPNVPTLVRDPESCTDYFICFDGIPTAGSCGQDLYFNPDIGQCDFPENVDCSVEVTGPTNVECRPEPGIHYVANPENCETYFLCIDGVKQEDALECAPGLIFDVNTSRCALFGIETKCVEGTFPADLRAIRSGNQN